jgi:hypothetical protein
MDVRRLAASSVLAFSASAAMAVELYIDRIPTQSELAAQYTRAKYEPRQGTYLGAYIDLDPKIEQTFKDHTGITRRIPDQFEKLTGRKHASYFFYLGYGRPAPTDWIGLMGMQKRIVHIALEPNFGLQYVLDNSYLNKLAEELGRTGVPIFLRFASEMNGDWLAWHGNPTLYKEKFRLVANKMKEKAPNVAMVWCPYATPLGPVQSYYPGDDVVDWVGVNIYNVTYFNQNKKTPAKQVGPTELLDPIYNWYAARKPIIIGEYGATHFSALEGKSVPDFAIGCIRALYSALPRRYPRVKAVCYFNTNNLDLEHARNNNYAVTHNPKVLAAYREAISSPWFLSDVVTEQDELKPQPMPLKDGATISGTVMVSGWAPFHRGEKRLRLKVNGKVIAEAADVSSWQAVIDASQQKPGRGVIEAEVIEGKKVTVGRRITVTFSR